MMESDDSNWLFVNCASTNRANDRCGSDETPRQSRASTPLSCGGPSKVITTEIVLWFGCALDYCRVRFEKDVVAFSCNHALHGGVML
jgi:hypothetical protein